MDFKSVYEQAMARAEYQHDVAHVHAVGELDRLFYQLIKKHTASESLFRLLLPANLFSFRPTRQLAGCYLWGGVGRGKTWLMDLFYQTLPLSKKTRLHFNDFMQQAHEMLELFRGRENPLNYVAGEFANRANMICLDEFHVDDIADAMMLYGLLEAMYKRSVTLIVTSNMAPDDLYKNGLQRSKFLPAIELLKQHNTVIHVEGTNDFRISTLEHKGNYIYPLSHDTDLLFEYRFNSIARGTLGNNQIIMVNNRPIQTRMSADNILWLDFEALCSGPRAASDYLVLADQYQYILISNVYRMLDAHEDIAKRFILLVDTLYDRNVKIMISATASPENLYQGQRFTEVFKRTKSRLEEIRRQDVYFDQKTSTQDNTSDADMMHPPPGKKFPQIK